MQSDLVLEILDFNYNRLYLTPNVISARVTRELGVIGDGTVTIPIDDPATYYIPDPNSTLVYDARWQLWEDNKLVFSGVVDETSRTIGKDDTFTFSGKHRGILIGNRNVGIRTFNGWPLPEIYNEFLRDNIGRAPFAVISSCSSVEIPDVASGEIPNPPITVIDGLPQEPNNWEAAATGANFIVVDLGAQRNVVAVRVMPPWWKPLMADGITFGPQKWYEYTIETSPDNSTWTLRATKTGHTPANDRGKLFEFTATCKYVRVTVTNSSDNIARLAQIMVYESLASVGSDTDFVVPWIENDDSGNMTVSGGTRLVEQGSFNGDGVTGNSFITRLVGSGSFITHRFRGTADAAFITQGDSGGTATMRFIVDGGTPSAPVTISGSTYQVKAFEILNLSPGTHTLKVENLAGTTQVDYFSGLLESAFRQVEDNDGSVGYLGTWTEVENAKYRRQFAHVSSTSGDLAYFEFKGDYIGIIGELGPTHGTMDVYIDDVFDATIDEWEDHYSYQKLVYAWSGTFADHTITVKINGTKRAASTGTSIVIDGFTGNFAHTVYMKSSFDNNNRMLSDLSEMVSAWLRYNDDGSVDLLSTIGTSSGLLIREGENEGGTIINADTTNDYSQMASAIAAVVSNQDGFGPTIVFTNDKDAEARMGIRVRVAEHANSQDQYMLVRQARAELAEYSKPVRKFTVQFDPSEVDPGDNNPLDVGETTILYSPRLNLDGTEAIRVGKIVTEWTSSA